jgi:hypothetical protein
MYFTKKRIYKALKLPFFMVKAKLQQKSKKTCFGTKEWSENSGICKRCEYKEDCGKIKKSKGL